MKKVTHSAHKQITTIISLRSVHKMESFHFRIITEQGHSQMWLTIKCLNQRLKFKVSEREAVPRYKINKSTNCRVNLEANTFHVGSICAMDNFLGAFVIYFTCSHSVFLALLSVVETCFISSVIFNWAFRFCQAPKEEKTNQGSIRRSCRHLIIP